MSKIKNIREIIIVLMLVINLCACQRDNDEYIIEANEYISVDEIPKEYTWLNDDNQIYETDNLKTEDGIYKIVVPIGYRNTYKLYENTDASYILSIKYNNKDYRVNIYKTTKEFYELNYDRKKTEISLYNGEKGYEIEVLNYITIIKLEMEDSFRYIIQPSINYTGINLNSNFGREYFYPMDIIVTDELPIEIFKEIDNFIVCDVEQFDNILISDKELIETIDNWILQREEEIKNNK